jgi:hypothetical protein
VKEVISKFGFHGMEWTGGRMVQFCKEAGLIAGNRWFRKKLVNKYMWLRDNGYDEALMDWIFCS